MSWSDGLSHPAVELPLPLDDATHEFEVPPDTTLFFWTALAVGTPTRIPSTQSALGSQLFHETITAEDQLSCSLSIAGESIPLVADSVYRDGDYTAIARWIAHAPIEDPTSVHIRFTTTGPPPMKQVDDVVLWTKHGTPIPWGTSIETTVELTPADSPPHTFPTHEEQLWNRHTVYTPREQ
ncbi:hypothetical protein [Halobacterium jilantaiense]|uniref:Uncharacterized protein n=1 Tax=Halobacterium jilantaiense TaxID=355548 RepID=A0A1I0NH95_9EURY|nr:hypothetical protein [Halobacterium jilantaiense]SEW00846.1 hypothetical protein SAMN04487945_0879 [Halobacterium jilantaiense]